MSEGQKKYQIRKAKMTDIPQLVGLIEEVMQNEIRLGNRTVARNPEHLRAGVMVQMGQMFGRPDVRIEVTTNGTDRVIGFVIGMIEMCPPTEDHLRCLRIWLDYINDDTLAGPKLGLKMWERVHQWGKEQGAGYTFAHILPKNIPSIRIAKHVGFRHHYTQFIYVGKQEQMEEV